MTRLLDDAASDAVYVADVRRYLFRDCGRAARPRFIQVGGQPGCGKTGAVLQAADELRASGYGAAVINGDELRAFHPQYASLVQQDRSTAADKTGADVGRWVEQGIREAALGGYNSVIETTMRQPVVVAGTLEAFRRAGHETNLRVLIVHPEISRQAIFSRFARALERADGLPRFTLESYHESALAKMPETLQVARSYADRISFLDRSGRVLYDSARSDRDPLIEFARLRGQPLALERGQEIDRTWRGLRSTLDRPGVPELVRTGVREQQERFARLLDQQQGKNQLHERAPDVGPGKGPSKEPEW